MEPLIRFEESDVYAVAQKELGRPARSFEEAELALRARLKKKEAEGAEKMLAFLAPFMANHEGYGNVSLEGGRFTYRTPPDGCVKCQAHKPCPNQRVYHTLWKLVVVVRRPARVG